MSMFNKLSLSDFNKLSPWDEDWEAEQKRINACMLGVAPIMYDVCFRLVNDWIGKALWDSCPICEGWKLDDRTYKHAPYCPITQAKEVIEIVKGDSDE